MSQEPAVGSKLETASAAWEQLCRHAEEFVQAWEAGTEPPAIAAFLPLEPGLRTMVLAELIKIDLEYRWGRGQCPRELEEYAAEFPELSGEGGVPCDLIYEEFHVRRQADPGVSPQDYLERFPRQADVLMRLLDVRNPGLTTTLTRRGGAGPLELTGPIDDFDVLATLGTGAFATVYLARQRSMQRLVALKVTAARGDEPQTMAQLDHPNIVRVFDQRPAEGGRQRLLYMEWVPGGTLQAVIDAVRRTPEAGRTGALLLDSVDRHLAANKVDSPVDDSLRRHLAGTEWCEVAMRLAAQVVAALGAAHEKGVLHRDLKPANVLLTASGVPKLADFNIAYSSKLDGASPTAFFGGSLAYMSPEQLDACNPDCARRPEELDARSDLYSLGVMLWELLSGSRPFLDERVSGDWAATLTELSARRRGGVPPEALAGLPSTVPGVLQDLLLRCLAPEPDERPETAQELLGQFRLVMQPKLQALLSPAAGGWGGLIRRHLALTIVLFGLLPNAGLSLLSIAYNWVVIVSRLDPTAQLVFLQVLLVAVNGVFYLAALAVALRVAWPTLRAIRSPPAASHLELTRRRSLSLGDWAFWITTVCWTAAGPLFPLVLQFGGATIGPSDYVHFFASHVISGVIAGTLCFFLLAFLNVRFVYPQLLRSGTDDPGIRALRSLDRRVTVYSRVAVAVPFVSAILLGFSQTGFRGAFAGLALVGTVALAASFWLAREIQSEVQALLAAAEPPAETWLRASDSLEWLGDK